MSVGGRGRDIPVEWESLHRTPPTPAPSEDRFFMDWSSLESGSPPVRMPPQGVLVREIRPDINNLLTRQLNLDWSQLRKELWKMPLKKTLLFLLIELDDSYLMN